MDPRCLRLMMAGSLCVGLSVWSVVLLRNSGALLAAVRRASRVAIGAPLWPSVAALTLAVGACALARSLLRDAAALQARRAFSPRQLLLVALAAFVAALFTVALAVAPFAV